MRKNKYGVFYTCFTEVKAVEYSLYELFKVYPDMPVYLVSDGGSDYSHLVDMFPGKKIETLLEHDSRGKLNQLYDHNYLEEDNLNASIDSIYTFIDRVKRAIEFCDCEHLLVMEPDVLVRGEFSIPEGAKLLGTRINSGLTEEMKEYMKTFDEGVAVNTWGATPAIFHADSFLKALDFIMRDDTIVPTLCKLERRVPFYDVLFPVMFGLIGIEETFNPEIVECLRNRHWRDSREPLVHQYREHYPLSSEGYNSTNGQRDHLIEQSKGV